LHFFNRFLPLYILVLLVLTGLYCYAATHHYFNVEGDAKMWWLGGYLLAVFISAFLISKKDNNNNYAGFTYHLATSIIIVGIAAFFVLRDDYEYTRQENRHALMFLASVWGAGLLLHFGIYFFVFRKKQIHNQEKDDLL
jgi:FtsH-binding integral membrane protein